MGSLELRAKRTTSGSLLVRTREMQVIRFRLTTAVHSQPKTKRTTRNGATVPRFTEGPGGTTVVPSPTLTAATRTRTRTL